MQISDGKELHDHIQKNQGYCYRIGCGTDVWTECKKQRHDQLPLSRRSQSQPEATIEHDCCNYLSERCALYDDGDYPLCVQHGLRYLVCPYFRDVVIHNNADLMEELLEIPKNAKQCRECRKFFVPTHRNSLYCPICRERIAAEKARKRSQKYRDQ